MFFFCLQPLTAQFQGAKIQTLKNDRISQHWCNYNAILYFSSLSLISALQQALELLEVNNFADIAFTIFESKRKWGSDGCNIKVALIYLIYTFCSRVCSTKFCFFKS